MKATVDRAVTVAMLFLTVVVGWNLAAGTLWGLDRISLGAGPGYEDWLGPLFDVAGATIVAVAGLGLVRQFWSWFTTTVLGRSAPSRVRRALLAAEEES